MAPVDQHLCEDTNLYTKASNYTSCGKINKGDWENNAWGKLTVKISMGNFHSKVTQLYLFQRGINHFIYATKYFKLHHTIIPNYRNQNGKYICWTFEAGNCVSNSICKWMRPRHWQFRAGYSRMVTNEHWVRNGKSSVLALLISSIS